MATYGLGNFKYDLEVTGKTAKFHFYDPEDVSNTADVSLDEKDMPAGVSTPDDRQVAEIAFAQCQKLLNDKRDARYIKNRTEDLKVQDDETKRSREAANDFLANAQDLGGDEPEALKSTKELKK